MAAWVPTSHAKLIKSNVKLSDLEEHVMNRIPIGWLMSAAAVLCMMTGAAHAQENAPKDIKSIGPETFEFLRQFSEYDSALTLDARVSEKRSFPGYTREKVVFRSVADNWVPGYLAIPDTDSGPYPCVLTMHGMGGSKGVDDPMAQALLKSGYAVYSLDAQYHGERGVKNGYKPPGMLLRSQQWNRYRGMYIQTTIDHRRAIDYLATREEIDTDRIGAFGYSMGGRNVFYVTAMDARVKAAVACVTPTARVQPSAIIPYNYAQGIDDRPFLMLMGKTDPFYTVNEAQQVFDLVDSGTKELVFYDSGHMLPPESTTKAHEWFETHLK
jgi:dienelactone hydrolase